MTLDSDIVFRDAEPADFLKINQYYSALSEETKRRFAPHSFEPGNLEQILSQPGHYFIHLCIDQSSEKIIAYNVTMKGSFDYDKQRWQQYSIILNDTSDCTFAPSVADEWQSRGLGQLLFDFSRQRLQKAGLKRMILWGGVQCSNTRAVNFYLKNGFRILGYFEYQGANYDMARAI